MDILKQIDLWGQIAPDRPAHISEHGALTYGELCRQSDSLAGQLAQWLPDDGAPVIVLGHKQPEMLVAFLGCVKAAHPYIPLDTALPAQRIARISDTAGVRLVLTPEHIAEIVKLSRPAPTRRVTPLEPYYIIFTSGSTGEPKGVVITLACLTSFVDWMVNEQRFKEGEIFLNQAPFSFDLSVMDLYLALVTGGTLFSLTARQIASPKHLYQALATSGVTTWVSTPSFAQMCLVEKSFSAVMLPQVQRFLFCGETLPPEIAAQLLDRFPTAQVWNTYGPTEATVATTSIQIDRTILNRYSMLPVGHSKPDVQILILDQSGQTVKPSEQGEIVIVGPNVSPGYLKRPDLTQRVFFDYQGERAYHTGDIGYVQDDLLFFQGRADNQVKLHGYRIELGDIESHLCGLVQVRGAVVLPILKQDKVEALAAFVILNEEALNGSPDDSDFERSLALRNRLADHLPSYMLPRKFYFLTTFPLTINGKIDRRQLAETWL
ncbi:MAG: D-alanine--poly(phosphoribitol) ligase subunit DltA [Chloroflexi bacterium]|nr:D-alanine--poly(phosphoribitol) ligase subunit DltA [Chloroflexota bacterium]